ncbi:outer kinetochore KNL1 complex subunit KNL1 [Ctenodactylus gundi]
MDGLSSETNGENDNIERPIRRRHSSILKPPRSPLQDLQGGNETLQESDALRNRKSSRRVSFADTIKVFQTESHMKIVRKSEITETEAGEKVQFAQNKNSEDNHCEITGMNTLLCAPIQTQLQQKEFSGIEHSPERKHAHDQTVVFSDENQMDLTASHTVMISKDLFGCSKSEKCAKIDTTSYLANLKHHIEDSRIKKQLKFSMDQSASSEKKINCNDFIYRLKTGKYNTSPFTGPDKENSEILIYFKEPNNASSTQQMCMSLHIDESKSNMTRCFRKQDDGMNLTQCHTAIIQTVAPTTSETTLRKCKGDMTVYGSDCMDLTVNPTIQVLPAADNLSETENQTQTGMIDVTTGYGTKTPGKKTIFETKLNAAFQDPSLKPQDSIHFTRSQNTGSQTHTVAQTSDPDARTMAVTQESVDSSPTLQSYKTVFYSSCNGAMDLTKCLSSVREEKNLPKRENNSKMCPNSVAIPPFMEKTIDSGEDSMDITKSHTVAIENQIFKQDQAEVQKAVAPMFEKEIMLQNHITMSEDGKMNVNYNSISCVSKERLQQNLSNIVPLSFIDKKTEVLAGEDVDFTEYQTSNLGSQTLLPSCNLSCENVCKSHSLNQRTSDDCGKLPKNPLKAFHEPNTLSKNVLTGNQDQEIYQILKIFPSYHEKDSPPSADYNQEKATNHNIVSSRVVLSKQESLENNRTTVSSEKSFSKSNPLSSSDGQSTIKNYNTAVNSHIMTSVQGQNSILPEPVRKNLDGPTADYSCEKIAVCSEEGQGMGLTNSHTVVTGFGPAEAQELSNTNLEHRTIHLPRINRQITVEIEKSDKKSIEKTQVFMSNDNMNVLEDKNTQKSEFLKEKENVKNCGRNSVGGQEIDKTVVFSEGDENDMDITKSYTVEINHRSLLEEPDFHLVPSAGTSKTVLYACGQDDMDITRSHTIALECKTVSVDEITARPVDKSVMFIDNHDELEMTKSHTIFIDLQAEERIVLPDRPNFEQSKRKNLQKPKVTSPVEQTVFFSESSENDHETTKGSQLTVPEDWSNNGLVEKDTPFVANENVLELSKLTTWKNSKDIQKPGFTNKRLPDKFQRRKSLILKNDKTIAFSENDTNDRDVTQSCVAGISGKGDLEDREDLNLMPLTGTSKTVLSAYGQDDMEITRNHTTTSACKTISQEEITIRPVDRTVMFVDSHNDLEVTKSHTVFIDCQATEKILQGNLKSGVASEKTLNICFTKGDRSVQENTKKQALTVESKIAIYPEQKHHMMPLIPTNICGSHDNYSCSPHVIYPFYNLDNNVMLCDKDKKVNKCPEQNDLANADDVISECHLVSEGLPVFAPCPLLKKEKVTQSDSKAQIDSAITLLKDQDLLEEPQNLLMNQALEYNQDLGDLTKFNSKHVSVTLSAGQMEALVDDCVASTPRVSAQQLPLAQKRQKVGSEDESILSKVGNKSLNFVLGNSFVPTCTDKSEILNNEKQLSITCKEGSKENIQTAKCDAVVDFHSNSHMTTQVIQTHANAREASGAIIASNIPCLYGKPNLNDLNGKTEEFSDFQTAYIIPPSNQLPELENKAYNNMSIEQSTEMCNVNLISDDATKLNKVEEDKNSHNGDATTTVPIKTVVKVRRYSLGIFLPRLPNRRNCSVTGIDDIEQIPADRTDVKFLETQPVSSKDSGIESVVAKLNLSPSQYINEEDLPICPAEINSSDSASIEFEEKALVETYQKEIPLSDNRMEETCNSHKRTWVQDEEDDVRNEKKVRKCEMKLNDTAQEWEIFEHHTESDIGKNANSILIKSLSRTPSSCSSSLDSIKGDGTSLDFSMSRNSQMESQFLRHTMCEENLREKLKDGRITIREFFILLQVHILIQKPRQSNLPAKFPVNTSPTLEDLMLRQHIYGPKIDIYREDCEVLRQKIEELKVSALNQDKLLPDVNRNLWEKMRRCSDEELRAFGIDLNKMKSRFTKMTKVFTHQGKVALYSKLVQSAQNEKEKLQKRIDEMDNILKKISNCLTEVEIETKNLEDENKDNPLEEWDSETRAAEKDLEQLKTQEEELQRRLLELEAQKEQTLAQINFMQKQTRGTEELLDQLRLSEWDVIEWSDEQAVFTFVYDTIELTITFGELTVGLPFLEEACRTIANLNFQSLLDEDKAPSSSILVHKLIFQYIEEQESWKKKCTTQHQIPKMLQELSLVVRNCRLLGEEIVFLKRWGPNYNLMDIVVTNTELTLLFSSSVAFAKFEITLSLSSHYPLVPLPFTFQSLIGSIGQDEVSTIVSKVPLEDNYLKNLVKQIYEDLLQDCLFYR